MRATLRFAPNNQQAGLRYAAQVLLDSMESHIALDAAEASIGQPAGLELPGGIEIGSDELAAMYACLSLEREQATGRLDHLGRFDESAVTWEVSQPWIDLKALDLAACISERDHTPAQPQSRFAVHITHDVDRTTLREPWSLVNALLADTGLRRNTWVPLRTALAPRTLLRGLERLLAYERAQGIGARFFLMPGPYGLMGRHATRTDSRWRSWQEAAKLIQDAGMAVGLHGSFYASELDGYRLEKDRLEQTIEREVTTHRNHYLHFDTTRRCSQLEAAGIRYDFSVGYGSRIGFRSGSARIHRSFDLLRQCESSLLSIPLLFMDTHLVAQDPTLVLGELQSALKEVRKVGGSISLLFHPEVFLTVPGAWDFFENVIDVCRNMGADLSGVLP